jgi:hypothetical protein
VVAEPDDQPVPMVAAENLIEWTGLLAAADASGASDRPAQPPPSTAALDHLERLGAFRWSRCAQAPPGACHRAETTQPRRDEEGEPRRRSPAETSGLAREG